MIKGGVKFHVQPLKLVFWSKAVLKVGFSGGSVVKNPPGNAGDVGSIPGLRRAHILQSN